MDVLLYILAIAAGGGGGLLLIIIVMVIIYRVRRYCSILHFNSKSDCTVTLKIILIT